MYTQLIAWFEKEGRKLPWRCDYSPYKVWVSETMLCQTQVERVIPRYLSWMEHFPDVFALAQAPLAKPLQIWEGLGYYARPHYMRETAKVIVETFQGEFPRDYRLLRQLPGIGEYTACALLSIAYNLPYPAIDGNAKRVFARLLDLKIPIQTREAQKLISEAAFQSLRGGEARLFNQAIMDLGALICLPHKPRCTRCPVREICLAFQRGTQTLRPVRKTSSLKEVQAVIALFFHEGKVLIRKRPEKGFLAGLWELPWKENASIQEVIAENSLFPLSPPQFVGEFSHTYCKRQVKAQVFLVPVGSCTHSFSREHRWQSPDGLGEYPFSSFHRKALKLFNESFSAKKGRA